MTFGVAVWWMTRYEGRSYSVCWWPSGMRAPQSIVERISGASRRGAAAVAPSSWPVAGAADPSPSAQPDTTPAMARPAPPSTARRGHREEGIG